MSSTKNTLSALFLLKAEPSYSGSATPSAATDGIQPSERFIPSLKWADDGGRAFSAGIAGTQRRIGASGASYEFSVKAEFKGLGASYTPSSSCQLHTALLASGLSASCANLVSWTYKPTDVNSTPTSAVAQWFGNSESRIARGVYSDLKFSADSGGPIYFEFPMKGIAAIPSSSLTAPTITYVAQAVVPVKAENISLTIGGVVLRVRSFSFEQNREISSRIDLNSTGSFAGFAPGRRAPKFTVTTESELASTFDPYAGLQAGTQYALAMNVGAVVNNRLVFSAPQAQLMDVQDGVDNSVATWTMVFDCPASGPQLNDDYLITTT